MSVHSRWSTKLRIRRTLLKAARARLAVARKHGVHPRQELVKLVEKREGQVKYAEIVVNRYKPKPLGERAFVEAQHLVGVLERGGNNTGPTVDKIIKANGGVIGEPWCGDFVAYVYRKAGSKLVTRSWAAVRLLLAGSTVRKLKNVRQGDIVRYDFTGPGSLSHTGVFDRWIVFGVSFQAIEGNTGTGGAQSDGVGDGVHRRTRSVSQVHDFRRVAR